MHYSYKVLLPGLKFLWFHTRNHVWFHTVHTRFLSKIFLWNQKKIIYEPWMKSKFSYMTPAWSKKNSYMIPSWHVRIHAEKICDPCTKSKKLYMIRVRNLNIAGMRRRQNLLKILVDAGNVWKELMIINSFQLTLPASTGIWVIFVPGLHFHEFGSHLYLCNYVHFGTSRHLLFIFQKQRTLIRCMQVSWSSLDNL